MNELVTITEFQKLRVKFNKETGMYAIKHKKEYTHWLEQELVNNINYTRCSTQLKDKKAFTFEDWLYKHQIKKIDRLYFAKDGTEQEFNSLHRRYVQTLQSL